MANCQSALGHKRTKLTTELCPLYPQKRTNRKRFDMSALCQKRTYALQQFAALFDCLVGARE
jgi:hypothetical protein